MLFLFFFGLEVRFVRYGDDDEEEDEAEEDEEDEAETGLCC